MKRLTWINLILGIWLIMSPFALGYSSTMTATANDVVLGILFLGCSAWIVAGMPAPVAVSWVEILCSVWLIATPFVRHYQGLPHAMTNDVAVGVIALLAALIETWSLMLEPTHA
jgi:hypothetical protein